MYSAPYGYGNAAGQAFTGAPPGQSPQMQPGPGQNQPQQQMMYNQQFSMGQSVPGGYAGAQNPGAMMPGAGGGGPAGMMQNTAMPQMPANGQMNFHTPYTSSPYGAGVPSTSGPQGQFNPNYMMSGPMGSYPMNSQQQLIQRMQQQQSQQASGGMGTPTPPRQFPGSQGTPNPTVPAQQGQFGTPSNTQAAAQNQTPTQAPPSANSVTTPQTPTFPMSGQGAVNGNSTPLSPNSQAKGQERISLLLEINQELLFEAINLRHNIEEVKREASSSTGPEQQKEKKEEEEAFAHDWAQVCRRLQANLAYLASLADRKQSSQPAPAYLTPPTLTMRLKLRPMPATPDAEKVDGSGDREDREKLMREQYQKLQTLFPGIDPNNVPVSRPQPKPGAANPAMAMQNAQRMGSLGSIPIPQSPASSAHHGTPQMSNAATPTNQATNST